MIPGGIWINNSGTPIARLLRVIYLCCLGSGKSDEAPLGSGATRVRVVLWLKYLFWMRLIFIMHLDGLTSFSS